ncbi:transmembrane protein, putative [Medicago truncatula]|uniref:Transmembrane protein, putative n=1 Tax=Medicago truncatula TaxID=3880 RepID=G7LB26_MEDTR|nr:transmembrane protein, putative [Medicago truncatula]
MRSSENLNIGAVLIFWLGSENKSVLLFFFFTGPNPLLSLFFSNFRILRDRAWIRC